MQYVSIFLHYFFFFSHLHPSFFSLVLFSLLFLFLFSVECTRTMVESEQTPTPKLQEPFSRPLPKEECARVQFRPHASPMLRRVLTQRTQLTGVTGKSRRVKRRAKRRRKKKKVYPFPCSFNHASPMLRPVLTHTVDQYKRGQNRKKEEWTEKKSSHIEMHKKS